METSMQDMINDWFTNEGEDEMYDNFNNKDGYEIYNKVKQEFQLQIYSGAKISKLSATLLLLNLQTTYGWSNDSLDSLLKQYYFYQIIKLNCIFINYIL